MAPGEGARGETSALGIDANVLLLRTDQKAA